MSFFGKKSPLAEATKQEEIKKISEGVIEKFFKNAVLATKLLSLETEEDKAREWEKNRETEERELLEAKSGSAIQKRPRVVAVAPAASDAAQPAAPVGLLQTKITNWEKADIEVDPYVRYVVFSKLEGREALRSRRYNEFKALYKTLKSLCPTAILPPASSKIGKRNLTDEFVDQRQRDLQKLLDAYCATDAIRSNPTFLIFLGLQKADDVTEQVIFARAAEITRNELRNWKRTPGADEETSMQLLSSLVKEEIKRCLWASTVVPALPASESGRGSMIKSSLQAIDTIVDPAVSAKWPSILTEVRATRKKAVELLSSKAVNTLEAKAALEERLCSVLETKLIQPTALLSQSVQRVVKQTTPAFGSCLSTIAGNLTVLQTEFLVAIANADTEKVNDVSKRLEEAKMKACATLPSQISALLPSLVSEVTKDVAAVEEMKHIIVAFERIVPITESLVTLVNTRFWSEVMLKLVALKAELAQKQISKEELGKALDKAEAEFMQHTETWGWDVQASGRKIWWRMTVDDLGLAADAFLELSVSIQARLHRAMFKKFITRFGDSLYSFAINDTDSRQWSAKVLAAFETGYQAAIDHAKRESFGMIIDFCSDFVARHIAGPLEGPVGTECRDSLAAIAKEVVPEEFAAVIDPQAVFRSALMTSLSRACHTTLSAEFSKYAPNVAAELATQQSVSVVFKDETTPLTALATRRSIRKFKSDPVSKRLIERILSFAQQAPSATGTNPWRFHVVLSPAVLTRISEETKKSHYSAPVVIFITTSGATPGYETYDAALATENLLLAATSYGLGSVVLSYNSPTDEKEKIRLILELQYSERLCPLAVAIGYSEQSVPTPSRPIHSFYYTGEPASQESTVQDEMASFVLRRSIRKYKPDAVPKELVDKVLTYAQLSPSAMGTNPWRFHVVSKPEVLKQIQEQTKKNHYDTPVLIFITNVGGAQGLELYDCALATETMVLAASALGLGSVILGYNYPKDETPTVRSILSIPEGEYICPMAVAMGFPDQKPSLPQRAVRSFYISDVYQGTNTAESAPQIEVSSPLPEALSALESRRSVRKYKSDPVPKELIEKMCHYAQMAPSAMGTNPWRFHVVSHPDTLKALQEKTQKNHYAAPVVIFISTVGGTPGLEDYDCALATENLVVSASALNLGSVILGYNYPKDTRPAIAELLSIPSGERISPMAVAVGYPDLPQSPPVPHRLVTVKYIDEAAVETQKPESQPLSGLVSRRSIRKYRTDPVPKEVLGKIFEFAQMAPSAMGTNPWRFHVVTNPDILAKLTSETKKDHYKAPVVVFISTVGGTEGLEDYDCALATENLVLAASSLGLGSVILGYNYPKDVRPIISEVLSIPSGERLCPMGVALGYPDQEMPQPTRKVISSFVSEYSESPAPTSSVSEIQADELVVVPMDETVELYAMSSRRSIRKYKNDPIAREVIEKILSFAQMAPSAMGTNPWRFHVVTDKNILAQLASETKKNHYNAPVVVFVSTVGGIQGTEDYDSGLATENLVLAATSYGVGSVILGYNYPQDTRPVIAKILSIPSGERLCPMAIALGYSEEMIPTPVRSVTAIFNSGEESQPSVISQDTLFAMQTRRSIRKYMPTPVPQALLEKIFQYAQMAPSAMGTSPWRFHSVSNEVLLKTLQERTQKNHYNAPVVVFISTISGTEGFEDYDSALATENLVLAAAALGLGSVILGYNYPKDTRSIIAEVLSIPSGERICPMAVALGFPDQEIPTPVRASTVFFVEESVAAPQPPQDIVCGCKKVTKDQVLSSGAVDLEELGQLTGAGTGCGKCKPGLDEVLDSSIICKCYRVSKKTIKESGATDVRDLGIKTHAGTGCGKCKDKLHKILASVPKAPVVVPSTTVSDLPAMAHRRSVRQFNAKLLERETIDKILSYAQMAPSAMGTNPWRFHVVETQAKISEIFAKTQKNHYAAPVLVFISTIGGIDEYATYDSGLATENLVLAASAFGVGSIILSYAEPTDETARVREILGLPSSEKLCPMAVGLGYTDAASSVPQRSTVITFHSDGVEDPIVCGCFKVTKNQVLQSGAKDIEELGRKTKAGTGCGKCREGLSALLQSTKPMPSEYLDKIVCGCFKVTKRQVLESGAKDLEELGRLTKAGTGCGNCKKGLQAILDEKKKKDELDQVVCGCFGVTKRQVLESGANDLEELGKLTKAGTGCGNCKEGLQAILDAKKEAELDQLVCGCFKVTKRQVLESGAKDVEELGKLTKAGTGCGECKKGLQEILEAKQKKELDQIVCGCFKVTKRQVLESGAKDLEELGRLTKAGTGCGNCKKGLQAILDEYQKKAPSSELELTALAARRSVRRYKATPVPKDLLQKVLEYGQQAPSTLGACPWTFHVVSDPALLQTIADKTKKNHYRAPALIFISSSSMIPGYEYFDCGVATETICVAAQALGLGTVILSYSAPTDMKEVVRECLGIDKADYFCPIAIAIGYPDQTIESPKRSPVVFFHDN